MGHNFSCFQSKCFCSSPAWQSPPLPPPSSLRGCLSWTTASLSWSKAGCPTLVSLRPMTLASSLSPTTEWSITAAPTQTRRPPGAPQWWTPTTPAPPPTSSPPPGAPQAPMRTEPTFLEVSLSALPLALVLPQQQPPPHQPPQPHPLPQPPQCPPQPQQQPPQPRPPPPPPPQQQQT